MSPRNVWRGLERVGLRLAIASALVLIVGPVAALGQEVGSAGVVGGMSQYDLSGTGTTSIVSFRGTSSLDRWLLAEVAVAYLPYVSQGEDQIHHLFPEAQVQAQWLGGGGIRPYLGLGAGASFGWAEDAESATDLTVSAAGGVRWLVRPALALQAELRIRSIDPWAGSTADWGLGVAGLF